MELSQKQKRQLFFIFITIRMKKPIVTSLSSFSITIREKQTISGNIAGQT
jgi:hypothetical protein